MIGIIGTGGHAKVIADIYNRTSNEKSLVFFTASPSQAKQESPFLNYTIYPDTPEQLLSLRTKIKEWHVAIGHPKTRKEKINWLQANGCQVASAIHDKSILAHDCSVGEGTSIMAGSVINPNVTIGKGSIINTTTSIDHDCQIHDFVSLGPGCKLAGGVKIGELSDLGAGAIVIPNISIGRHCVIGAGAVVISDIPDHSLAVGVPAKVIRYEH
jgi:acetyltransferase EpsM